MSLSYIGLIYDGFGEYENAKSMHEQARDIFVKAYGKDSIGYAQILGNLAGAYLEMEELIKAEKYYLEGIRYIEKRLQSARAEEVSTIKRSLATAYNNLASVYRRNDQFEKAEDYYLRASKILKEELGERNPRYITNMNNLGALYSHWGRQDLAESYYLKSLKAMKEVVGEQHPRYLRSLTNLGGLYFKMGKYEAALDYCHQAILANMLEQDSSFITDFSRLSTVEVISESELLDVLKAYADGMYHKGVEMRDKADLIKSYSALDVVKLRVQNVQKSFSRDKDKFRKLEGLANIAVHAIEIAEELKEEQYLQKAFQFAEQNKSVLLASALQSSKAKSLSNLPEAILKQEASLQKQWAESNKNLILARTKEEKASQRAKMNELNVEIKQFQEQLKANYPEYHAEKYSDFTISLEKVQEVLDENTLLLEYFLSEEVLYIFAISSKKFELLAVEVSRKKINESIAKLRTCLTDYAAINEKERGGYSSFVKESHYLYQQLLEKALNSAVIQDLKQLIIIPDGQLGYIPFEILLKELPKTEQAYNQLYYLLKDYSISYNYSASLLGNLKGEKIKENAQVLAMAASYGGENLVGATRSPHLRNLRKVLMPLPAAEEEVKALEQYFEGAFLWGEAATEAAFKEKSGKYSIIHLAMHGILNTQSPILSSLAFTEDHDSLENNFLQAYEIAQLPLDKTEMVVLSACETGYGRFQNGEGVMSLARSFMYAGVPSLVVSLWQVNDLSTSMIMQQFYKNLAKGMNKAEALKRAKLSYIAEADDLAAHPAFWAAFIQLGDSSSIQLQSKSNSYWIWWVGAAVLGALFILLLLRSARASK